MLLVDGNNWFRRRLHSDITGYPVKECFWEMQNSQYDVNIVVWDGYNSLSKRREIFPDYKAQRQPTADEVFSSQKLLQKVLKLSKVIQIIVPDVEADDVLAHLVYKYHEKVKSIFIESNDADLGQLGVPLARDTLPEEPQFMAIYKAIVGDSSDGIKGVQGFGDGTWAKLNSEQKSMLRQIVVNCVNCKEGEVREKLKGFPLSTTIIDRLVSPAVRKQVNEYYRIIKFLPVEEQAIAENTFVGSNRPDLVKPIFEEYMF